MANVDAPVSTFPVTRSLPITALVVTLNAEGWLEQCLASIPFCAEILVVDLGSSDRSVEIARKLGAGVIAHARVPFAEALWPEVVPLAKHDWIMRFDPDEVFDAGVAPELAGALADETAAVLRVPYRYYFRRRALRTTVWGGLRHMTVFFHRGRVSIRGYVHDGLAVAPGFRTVDLDREKRYPVRHYWVDDWAQMREKHERYLRSEGPDRLARGERFGWGRASVATLRALGSSLLWRSGWRGGTDGWRLSFFYAGYVWRSHWSLRAAERAVKREGGPAEPREGVA